MYILWTLIEMKDATKKRRNVISLHLLLIDFIILWYITSSNERISAMVTKVDSSLVTIILYFRLIISYIIQKTSHTHNYSTNRQSIRTNTIVQKFESTHERSFSCNFCDLCDFFCFFVKIYILYFTLSGDFFTPHE